MLTKTRNERSFNLLGAKRIKSLHEAGLPDPVFEESCGGLRVTIRRPRNITRFGGVRGVDFGDDLSIENQKNTALDRQMKLDFGDDFGDEKLVYTIIMASPEISQPQMAKITGISPRSVSRIVSRLKEYGYIKRHGSDRKGCWECMKECSDGTNSHIEEEVHDVAVLDDVVFALDAHAAGSAQGGGVPTPSSCLAATIEHNFLFVH